LLLAILGAVLFALQLTAGQGLAEEPPDPVDVAKIWDAAPHNAFTDLIEFGDELFLTFREGTAHSSMDGQLRVLASSDGNTWTSVLLLIEPGFDLRDPKLSITPGGMLMLNAAAARRDISPSRYQSVYWTSPDGRTWSGITPFGDLNFWLWRVAWHGSVGYSVGYRTIPPYHTALYTGNPEQGIDFSPVINPLVTDSYPNETVLLFRPNGDLLALTRRDPVDPYAASPALLGRAAPPYADWSWTETNFRVGGPDMLELSDGRIVVGARLYSPTLHTALLWLDPQTAAMTEFVELPSGGDTGYPGIIVRDGKLWVSYYASHEGKSNIYLARGISLGADTVRLFLPVVSGNDQPEIR
jgi:hypothetical protein